MKFSDFEFLLIYNLDKILHTWFVVDNEGKVVYWPALAEKNLGFEAPSIQNKSVHLLFKDIENEAKTLFFLLNKAQQTKSVIDYRVRFRKKNGVIIDAVVSINHLVKPDLEQKSGENEISDLRGGDTNSNYSIITLHNITEIVELQKMVNSKMKQLYKQFEIHPALPSSKTLDDVFGAILVAITAGQGLRFNRAFLLVVDEGNNTISGKAAIGPSSGDEAATIYQSFLQEPKSTLSEAIDYYNQHRESTDQYVNQVVSQIEVSLEEEEHILVQSLTNNQYYLVDENSRFNKQGSAVWLKNILHVNQFIIVPLIWQGMPSGIILADNMVTNIPITPLEIRSLVRFAESASAAIETTKLFSILEEKIIQLRKSYQIVRENQAQLVLKEKLAVQGELMAQMAHEVRGPLAVIGGYVRRIFNQSQEGDAHYECFQRIIDTVKTLENVVNDTLQQIHPVIRDEEPSDIHKVINKVLTLLDEEIQDRGITVNLNVQGNLPKVEIQDHRLFEVINNLIKNAVEALGEGGVLAVSTALQGEWLVVNIMDSGPGILPEVQKRLFSPFYTTKPEGTGLGLAIVKKLVDGCQGKVEVFSAPGVGATFKVSFPVSKSNRKSKEGEQNGSVQAIGN